MSSLTRYEQETIINFNREGKEAVVYTADPVMIRRMDRLCEKQPDLFQITETFYFQDTHEICAKEYFVVDKNRVKILPKREYTEEQLQALRERGFRLAGMRPQKETVEEDDLK